MKKSMKFILPMAALGLFVASATRLHAQYAQTTTSSSETTTTTTNGMPPPPPSGQVTLEVRPGYADFHYAESNYAAHRGYNEGYDKGLSDFNTHHSFRYKDDNSYRHPAGQSTSGMSESEYTRYYREAYERGYEHGYRHATNESAPH